MDFKKIFDDKRIWFSYKSMYINTGNDDIETVRRLLLGKDKKFIEIKKFKELE